MIWVLPAILCSGILLFFFEGARRAGQLHRARYWLLGMGIALPVLLGAYVWQAERQNCSPMPPTLDMDLSNASLEERLKAFGDLRDEVSKKLQKCGGSVELWTIYSNLETLILELEQQINAQLLETS